MYLSTLSILLPLVLGAVFFDSLTLPLRILYFFIVICGIFELWSLVLFYYQENNLFLFHFQTIAEFVLLSLVYITIFDTRRLKSIVLVSSIAVTAYLIFGIFKSDLGTFDSTNRIVESSVLIFYFILFMIDALNRMNAPNLEMQPYFILTSGLIVYFAGTSFVFLLSNHISESSFLPAWTIHNLLNIFLNVIYASVIWRSKKVSNIS